MINRSKIAQSLSALSADGYAFLPELKFEVDDIMVLELLKSRQGTHVENSLIHLHYLDDLGVKNALVPELLRIIPSTLHGEVDPQDLYCITKIVNPGEASDSDRAHFDSHLFTLVTPIRIPKSISKDRRGQLIVFSKLRAEPKSEFFNFFEKLYYFFFYSSSRNLKKLASKFPFVEFDFYDLVPVIFLGRQCFHSSVPFEGAEKNCHILLITHFFDPSPSWGVGRVNRFIRNR
jgi:hypothetical protein